MIIAIAGLGGAGCSGAPTAPPPRAVAAAPSSPVRGGTLTMDVLQDLATLDPANLSGKGIEIGHLLFDTLLELANPPAVSPDGLTYTFTLRAGATYADGTPIRADDFAFAFERLLDPKLGALGASLAAGVRSARAHGDRELEIVLEKPDTSFPMHLIMPQVAPIPRAYPKGRLRSDPPASGPFRIAEWHEGRELVLVRNDRHAHPAYLDRIVIHLAVAQSVASLRFLRGETDLLIEIDGTSWLRILRTPAWRPYVMQTPALDAHGIAMNTSRPPLDDKRVRQALNLAFRKQDFVVLSHGRYRPAYGPIPPGIPGFDESAAPWPHDPARARELLAAAGVKDLHLTYLSGSDQAGLLLAQSLQADLAEVGVRLEILPTESNSVLTLLAKGDFDLALVSWGADFPDPSTFFVAFDSRWIHPTASLNHARYRNRELDALIDEAAREKDAARRIAVFRRAEALVHDECPWIWLAFRVNAQIRQPDIHLGPLDPLWQFDLRDAWRSPSQ